MIDEKWVSEHKVTMFEIEEWWRHLGCYDRENASGIPYINGRSGVGEYLTETDNWWDNLKDEEKREVYINFFSED